MTEQRKGDNSVDSLTKAEKAFLEFSRKFGWGKLEVTIKDGQPVMVTPIKQEFKLD